MQPEALAAAVTEPVAAEPAKKRLQWKDLEHEISIFTSLLERIESKLPDRTKACLALTGKFEADLDMLVPFEKRVETIHKYWVQKD